MSARILVIDPDPLACTAFKNALKPKEASWTLTLATSTKDALEQVTKSPPDIIVTSSKANSGNGLALLSQLVDEAPLAHPFIKADESEKPSMAKALEGGCGFLRSDLSEGDILAAFKLCLSQNSWQSSPMVAQVLEHCSELQSLPESYLQIARAIRSSNSTISDIAEHVSLDLALSAKVLETVNSPFYGFGNSVNDVSQAINLIGLSSLESIVLAVKVFDYIHQSTSHCALVSELWNHSIDVAAAARRIALHHTEDPQAAERAYSAGLLHDIGKLILLETIPEQFLAAQRNAHENSISTWRSELSSFGCDHAEVGAKLLHTWKIPGEICQAVAMHHRPANACETHFSVLTAVHAANTIVRKRKKADHPDAIADQAYLDEIGLSDKRDEWECVAKGQALPAKRSLRFKKAAPPEKEEEPHAPKQPPTPEPTTTKIAHDALSQAIEDAEEKRKQREKRLSSHSHPSSVYLAFAAGIICCLSCIYFLSTIEDAPAKEESSHNFPEPPQGANYGSRKDVLEELMSSGKQNGADELQSPTPTLLNEVILEKPEPPPPFPKVELGAIFQRSTGAKAQINGRILGIGDSIGEARITNIEPLSVTIEHYGRTKTITLK